MLAVEFSSGCEFGLVLRFKALLAIPPGAAAIEIIPNIRRTDDWHFSPQRILHWHLHALQVGTQRVLP